MEKLFNNLVQERGSLKEFKSTLYNLYDFSMRTCLDGSFDLTCRDPELAKCYEDLDRLISGAELVNNYGEVLQNNNLRPRNGKTMLELLEGIKRLLEIYKLEAPRGIQVNTANRIIKAIQESL
jgi:hypothetical protein